MIWWSYLPVRNKVYELGTKWKRKNIQSVMKKDGRTHDRKTKEALRVMPVARIREGEDVATVMSSLGLCRTRRTSGWTRSMDVVEDCTVWPHTKAVGVSPNSPTRKDRKSFVE